MPIYTKKGDLGQTSLGSGERVWKHAPRVDTYGTIDELNSFVGMIISEIPKSKPYKKKFIAILTLLQNDLFCIGSYLANLKREDIIKHLSKNTTFFEKEIDNMTKVLIPLSNFILPGGGKIGARFQFARTLARRAERKMTKLLEKEEVNPDVVQYLNRLSDLLFTMSRFANFKDKKKETIWKI